MQATFQYRNSDWHCGIETTRDVESVAEAQEYAIRQLKGMIHYNTCCILIGSCEIVISKATNWQKANG